MKEKNSENSELTQFNFRKNELVRLIVQTLESLDCNKSAKLLEEESGIQLHSPEITKFRQNIVDGKWEDVLKSLSSLNVKDSEKIQNIKFLVYRQKYLEQLESKQTKEALQTLRQELAPNTMDTSQLHKLTSLVMCQSPEELKSRASWSGSTKQSRQDLLGDLHKYLPSHLMVPENRLQKLLLQAIEHQKQSCIITSDDESSSDGISLLREVTPVIDTAPKDTIYVLEDHTDEVWNVQFSPNGKYLASCSADKTIIIYDLSNISDKSSKPIICTGHSDAVSFIAWSPDSTMLLSCSNDKQIKLWDIKTGNLIKTFGKHKDITSACAWLPDNKHFVSAGGRNDKTIRRWNVTTGEQVDSWKMNYRITDIAINKDGSRLVVIAHNKKIHVYHPTNKNQCFTLTDSEYLTSLALSPCGRYALCNISREDESGKGGIHMWDLEEKRLVREYSGHKQTKYVLRTAFGGKNMVFISSGSEDYSIYIWERTTSKILHKLEGHVNNVNAVAWNPVEHNMFASASDDMTVRIWGRKTN